MGGIGGAATGATLGALKGSALGWVGAAAGLVIGGAIGYITSIDDEEIQICNNAENELSQIDSKADKITSDFEKKLKYPSGHLNVLKLNKTLKENPVFYKNQIRQLFQFDYGKGERFEFSLYPQK